MKRYIERERPRRANGWLERRKLQIEDEKLNIEDEKLQSSRDFKEITFAITLFGGLLAFFIKLGDYFNNNVLAISEYSQSIIYFTAWFTLIVLALLFSFLILKWCFISTQKKFLKKITQYLFGLIPLFIVAWFISLFINVYTNYPKNTNINFNKYILILIVIIVLTFVVLKRYSENKPIISNKTKNYSSILSDYIPNILSDLYILYWIFIFLIVISVLLLPVPAYFLTGSYSIEKFPPSDTNHDIITFTIRETGISFYYNYLILNKLEEGYDIFHYIDNVTINGTQETVSKNKLMLGIQHDGLWYLNLNTSNLTSGNYMLHAEVTNDITKISIFGTIKKHDDILFYIPPKTELNSYNSTNQE